MAGKQKFDRKLADLQALRDQGKSEAAREALRMALGDKNNFVVSKAALLAGELGEQGLFPELAGAFDRFLEDGAKTDPQCYAKNAIAQVLKDFEYEDPELYVRGLRHRQPEPVYGGQQDTAATLRATCAHALLICRSISDLKILGHLTDLLSDSEHTVRLEAARAIAALGRPEGALLLRLKIACGDGRSEVTGQCMSALLALDAEGGMAVVGRYLNGAGDDADLPYEAAAALGESREPAGFELLRERYERPADPHFRKVLLLSMGASLLPEAVDFLLSLIRADQGQRARDAIAALEPARYREEVRVRVEEAIRNAFPD
ncbi:MAG: HEAT repeat domain-containing protein [Bryobacterales bacterium]|nr:HEAT repeat domain-containing protein [Bryobacterales bacterium]